MIDIYAYEELNQEHIFLQDNHASDFFFTVELKILKYVYLIEKKKLCRGKFHFLKKYNFSSIFHLVSCNGKSFIYIYICRSIFT